ncbi:MAG: prepilin-type N-terminal cleavage/methylation domain-containing protein [Patescibacteria group bacterium]|jgi:prepilin-type N-terminal cleavage/methylation domain-containing protein
MKKGFTFIEILVVVTIIALLTTVAVISYSSFLKQGRDAKRKADLEQVRAALEMYKSSNDTYPVGVWTNLSVLTGATIYIQSLPTDPKDSTNDFYYGSADGSDYILAAQLENSSSCTTAPGGNACGTGNPCNYCMGPYGQK